MEYFALAFVECAYADFLRFAIAAAREAEDRDFVGDGGAGFEVERVRGRRTERERNRLGVRVFGEGGLGKLSGLTWDIAEWFGFDFDFEAAAARRKVDGVEGVFGR